MGRNWLLVADKLASGASRLSEECVPAHLGSAGSRRARLTCATEPELACLAVIRAQAASSAKWTSRPAGQPASERGRKRRANRASFAC